MKNMIIYPILVLVLASLCFAVTTRSVDNNVITYTTNLYPSNPKAYWAIYEVVPSECSVTSIICDYIPFDSLGDCNYYSSDRSIRVAGYTAEEGGDMSTEITVTASGSGTCFLDNGEWVESYNDGQGGVILGEPVPIGGGGSLILGDDCNTDADLNCDGCVSDIEFPPAVADWKGPQNYIDDFEFPIVVNQWKTQEGC